MIGKVLYGTLAAAILTLPAVATAQRDRGIVEISAPGTRGGFFISGGLGAGAEQFKFSDEEDYSETLTKPTLTLRLGGTPSEQVRLGVEVFGWMAETEEGDESFGAVLGVVQFYPMADQGLFLKGGGGFGRSAIEFLNGATTSESGFAWSVGAGYEFPLSRALSIGPSVELYQASFTQRDEPTLYERVLNIGVQLTFQTGGGWR